MPFGLDAMPHENPTVGRRGAVAVLTVTRPAVLDALNETAVTLADGCAREAGLFGPAAAAGGRSEGARAFLQKRRPRFTGS